MGVSITSDAIPQLVQPFFGGTGGVRTIYVSNHTVSWHNVDSGFYGSLNDGDWKLMLDALTGSSVLDVEGDELRKVFEFAGNPFPLFLSKKKNL